MSFSLMFRKFCSEELSFESKLITYLKSALKTEAAYTQTDMTFKKTRKNALKKRKYGVFTVDHRKNAVFTNS